MRETRELMASPRGSNMSRENDSEDGLTEHKKCKHNMWIAKYLLNAKSRISVRFNKAFHQLRILITESVMQQGDKHG